MHPYNNNNVMPWCCRDRWRRWRDKVCKAECTHILQTVNMRSCAWSLEPRLLQQALLQSQRTFWAAEPNQRPQSSLFKSIFLGKQAAVVVSRESRRNEFEIQKVVQVHTCAFAGRSKKRDRWLIKFEHDGRSGGPSKIVYGQILWKLSATKRSP